MDISKIKIGSKTYDLKDTASRTKLAGIEDGAQAHKAPTKSEITTALGYTPYNATNPNGYTSNAGTVTGVKVGSSGSTLSPSSGVVTIPAYESGAQVHKAPTTAEVKSALGTGSGTSKYLREDGTWATPPDNNTNTAKLQVSDTTNKKINTTESTSNYIQFTAGTNKFTVSDGTNSFDVGVTPSISNNVTGSSLTADKVVLGNGNSTVKTSSKGIATTLGSDDTTIPTSKAVRTAITDATAGLTGAMHFIGSSSTAVTDGGTEAPTIDGYSGTAKTAGNVVLYGSKEFVWTGSAWELLGDEGSYALNSVSITGTGALGGGGTLAANRTITHNTSGVTAASYGPTANVSGSNGATIKVPQITVDSYGHVTGVTERTYTSVDHTYTIPTVNNGTYTVKTKVGDTVTSVSDFTANQSGTDDVTLIQGTNVTLTPDATNRTVTIAAKDTTYSAATTSAAGLMSATDKSKLDGIATGATANTGTITGIKMNGASKGTSGVVDLGTVITAHQDISGKADKSATVSTIAYDATNKKLTKTINGTTSDVVTVSTLKTDLGLSKSDVGLGNVGNFKAVSTVASQGLSSTEQANARANIGAGTSSFSGSYNDLSNKPTIPAAAANGTFSVKTKVGSNSAVTAADFTANQSSADDITFIQGTNVTLTTDTTNRTVTIAAKDTTYSAATASAAGLMSAVDFKKINAQAIPENANLNDYTNDGWYYCSNNSRVATFTNCPTTNALYMEVHTHAGKYQHIVEYMTSGAKHYHRNYYNDAWGAWTEWKLTDNNTVTSINGKTGAIAAADIATVLTGAGYKLTDANTWKAATTSQEGYVPTLALSGTSSGAQKDTINTQASDYVLTYTSGTETAPVWRKLPANAYANSTYTVNNGTFTVKGAGTAVSSTSANASGNTAVDIVAGSNVTITPDATNGKITIASTDTNTWRPVGTGASDAAAGNHTHGISLATDTGTNQVTLAHNTKYKLTAGGQSIVFTTPTDNNTNTTYTFAGGTNKFTVTPSGGSAQDVTVTPSISNNVTASGNFAADAIIVGNAANQVAKNSGKTITTTAPSSSAADTTVPTSKAVWTAIGNGIATNDAMVYKGTIAGGSTGSYGALTAAANKGWTYKVSTAGKINGVTVEVGDMIICNTDSTAAATSDTYSTIAANWDVIQTNVDGALFKSSNSFTDAHVLVADGTAGKVKDSGFTIGKSVPSNAVFTDTNTAVTAVGNHYAPTADSNSALTASASGATAAWSIDVVKGVTLSRDAKGHVTAVSVTSGKIPGNPNTDRYVNSAAFADNTSSDASNPLKMTLTRAGSDTSTVTANLPKVSSSSAGVVPKGATVSSQSQSTKFLREDGTWAAPSYTTNTNTDTLVTQTATTTSANYEVLFSATADNTTRTEGARKNSNLTFNPSTGNLNVTQINGVTVGSSPKFTDNNTTYSAGTGLSLSGTTFSLATSGVTAGTYKRVTVDAYGRVTAGDQTDADSDTKNTAGTTNKTGTKMFLAAATEQSANPVTYSNSNCYIGTDNCLYSGGTKVLTAHQDISGKQATVAKLGSTTKPVYTSAAGTFAECSTYAGGTAVTLNGSGKGGSTASFYAPTGAGASGQYLISNGSGAPSWTNIPNSINVVETFESTTSNTDHWYIFASIPADNTVRAVGCTMLVGGAGYYYGTYTTGLWAIEIRSTTDSSVAMYVSSIIGSGYGTTTFGYYTDTTANKVYFGVYSSGRNSDIVCAPITNFNNHVTYENATYTTAPTGWTAAAITSSYYNTNYDVNVVSSASGAVSLSAKIPVHHLTVTGNISGITLSNGISVPEGHSVHVILYNSSTSDYTAIIQHTNNCRCPRGGDLLLTVPVGGYMEVDFLRANNKFYVRGV